MNWTRTLSAAALSVMLTGGLACNTNHRPNAPAVPSGPSYCSRDTTYTFTTVASDPDGDSIALRFDWGDSTFSHWVGWFASGDTVASTHAWSDTGTYEVRVSAQDRQLTSDLSESLEVRVAIRWPPETPAAPLGPDRGGQDSSYRFIAGADHPDGIPVAIRFAWGDGDTSDWSEFDLPGGPVDSRHAWSTPDTYAVTAQAKDTGELTSLWSPPHALIIRPRDTLLLWRVRLAESYMISSPAIAPDGTIYVGSSDKGLYALEPRGIVKWRYSTGGEVQSSPAIASDGTVYVGSNDSCLYAVNPDGTLKWKYVTSGSIRSSPAIASDGTVYFGSNDDYLYAASADGTLKWRYLTGLASSPAIGADGTVYYGSDSGYVYALNDVGPNAILKWRYFGGAGVVFGPPAIGSDGTIYCGTYESFEFEGSLCALNPDGSLRWASSTNGGVSSSPAIAVDGTIYAASMRGWWSIGGGLCALNPDGTTRWNFWCDEGIWYPHPEGIGGSSPAVSAYGTVYFGSYGYFHALYPDGALKWRYETGARVESSPTIGADGTVYFTCDDGYLYALKGTGSLANSPWPKFHRDLRNTGRSDEGGWSRLMMVGAPILHPDSAGFMIRVINDGTVEASVGWLEFYDTPESAYMRNFMVQGDYGIGYPIPNGMPGTGLGDTVHFEEPVTIAPNGTQMVEVLFTEFHLDELGNDVKANVSGKVFIFRFDDGSVITVRP